MCLATTTARLLSSMTPRAWCVLGRDNYTKIQDSSKAAADGTAIWAARLAVVGRVTRVSYGLSKWVRYDSADPEHRDRKRVRGGAGYDRVGGQWRQILGKVWTHCIIILF